MTNLEIKNKIDIILSKINDNTIDAWNATLDDTTQAIVSEDYYGGRDVTIPSVVYNGWIEDLENLLNDI